jgi:hypothetical protein
MVHAKRCLQIKSLHLPSPAVAPAVSGRRNRVDHCVQSTIQSRSSAWSSLLETIHPTTSYPLAYRQHNPAWALRLGDLDSGFDAYLLKPARVDDILKLISNLSKNLLR